MAKRNSTKTATKEALQSSEPRLQTFKGWAGMNIETSQRSWTPLESIPKTVNPAYNSHTSNLVFKQTDEKSNTALIQNNLRTLADGTLETRNQEFGETYSHLANLPTYKTFGYVDDVDERIKRKYSFDNFEFTNITYLRDNWLYSVINCTVYIYNADKIDIDKEPEDNTGACIGVIKKGNLLARISITNLNINKNNWNLITTDSRINAELTADKDTGLVDKPYICEYANKLTCVYSCLSCLLAAGIVQESLATVYGSDAPANIFATMPSDMKKKRIGNGVLYSDDYTDIKSVYCVSSCDYIDEPYEEIKPECKGDVEAADAEDQEAWCTFWYTVNTKYGSTLFNVKKGTTTPNGVNVYLKIRPINFTGSNYIKVSVTFTKDRAQELVSKGATDIEFWFSEKGSEQAMVIGRVAFPDTITKDVTLTYSFYGSMYDTDQLATMSLSQPDYNTTQGPEITKMKFIDSRMYFYGSSQRPYRLYMGGTSTMELAVSRGKGGGFIDCEPGSGAYITAVHKFKTQSGATIVTFLTGNKNTGQQKRYNLIETQITITSEIAENSWKYEEVTNVIGTNSYNGSVVCADGLYMLSRYGLHVTTQAMEYNSQLRSQKVSSAITPIFENRLSPAFDNAVLIYIDEVIYFIFGCEDDDEYLDHIIFCYDINTHAIYTYSYGDKDTDILNILPIDYIGWSEGIGIVTPACIDLIPTVGLIRTSQHGAINLPDDDNVSIDDTNVNSTNIILPFKNKDNGVLQFTSSNYNKPKTTITYGGKTNTPSSEEYPMAYASPTYCAEPIKSSTTTTVVDDVPTNGYITSCVNYNVPTSNKAICLGSYRFCILNLKKDGTVYYRKDYWSTLWCNADVFTKFINYYMQGYEDNLCLYIPVQMYLDYKTSPNATVQIGGSSSPAGFSTAKHPYARFIEFVDVMTYDDKTTYEDMFDADAWCNKIEPGDNYGFFPVFVQTQPLNDWTSINSKGTELGFKSYKYLDESNDQTYRAFTSSYVRWNSATQTKSVNNNLRYQAIHVCEITVRDLSLNINSEIYLPTKYFEYTFSLNDIDLSSHIRVDTEGHLFFGDNASDKSTGYAKVLDSLLNVQYKKTTDSTYQNYSIIDSGTGLLLDQAAWSKLTVTNILGQQHQDQLELGTQYKYPTLKIKNIYAYTNLEPLTLTFTNEDNEDSSYLQAVPQIVPLLWQTGELSTSTPAVGFMNLSQLEFHFDYLQTDSDGLKITINAVDYYGREIEVTRTFVQTKEQRNYIAPLRIDAYIESYNIRMEGKASLRMTHICARVYVQGKKARQVYGHEALMHWITPNGDTDTNVQINSYNDLYRAIIP